VRPCLKTKQKQTKRNKKEEKKWVCERECWHNKNQKHVPAGKSWNGLAESASEDEIHSLLGTLLYHVRHLNTLLGRPPGVGRCWATRRRRKAQPSQYLSRSTHESSPVAILLSVTLK
jgi:hypothetical protein